MEPCGAGRFWAIWLHLNWYVRPARELRADIPGAGWLCGPFFSPLNLWISRSIGLIRSNGSRPLRNSVRSSACCEATPSIASNRELCRRHICDLGSHRHNFARLTIYRLKRMNIDVMRRAGTSSLHTCSFMSPCFSAGQSGFVLPGSRPGLCVAVTKRIPLGCSPDLCRQRVGTTRHGSRDPYRAACLVLRVRHWKADRT